MASEWSPNQVLARAVSGQRRTLGRAMALLAGHQVGEALVPVLIGVVIDRAVGSGDAAALVRWLVVLAGLFAALSLCYRFGARANVASFYGAVHDLRLLVADRLLDPRGGTELPDLPGELLNVTTSDVERVATLNSGLAGLAAAVGGLLVALVALFRVSLVLGGLVVVLAPLLLAGLQRASRPLQRASAQEQDQAAAAAGLSADLVRGLRVLHGIGATQVVGARYRQASRRSLRATMRAAVAEAGFDGATTLVIGLFLVVVALVAGRLAVAGDITVGELVAVVGLAQFLLGPLNGLASISSRWARAHASAERVARVLSAPLEGGHGHDRPASVEGRLQVQAASPDGHADPDGHASPAGHRVELDVAPGEHVGVVMADRGDADALVSWLAGRAQPPSGVVRLDGVPYRSLDPSWLHRAVLVSGHEAELFGGTVRQNLLVSGTDPTRLAAALAASAGDDVVANLPDGLDTELTEGGRSLSGGQRQRLVLARALLVDAPVLVLDEPTTAVDAATEAAIAPALRRLRAGRTTIVVATSPTLLAACDRVVAVAGDDTWSGRHHDLVTSHEGYRQVVLA